MNRNLLRAAFGLGLVVFAAAGLAAAPPDTLSVPEREDHTPTLAVNPTGQPVIAWIATAPDTVPSGPYDELYFSQRGAGGWSAPTLVAGPGDYYGPRIVYSTDGARWICWAEHAGTDSKIRVRRDLGGSSQTFTLDDPLHPDLEPSICAARADSVVVVWQAWRSNNYEILMSVGNASGFATTTQLSECSLNDREPDVVWGNNRAWVVWSSYRGEPYQILCRTFDGTTLTATVSVTNSLRARNLHPKLAFDATNNLLWVHWSYVNQGWNGFNNSEPGLTDLGSPRIRAYDGTTLYAPQGLNTYGQYPLVPMETLGYQRYLYDGGTRPQVDRNGTGLGLVMAPGSRLWCFHKQTGTLDEFGEPNLYWGVVGLNYAGNAWSQAAAFLDLRSTLGWEAPAAVATADSMFVAWSADDRAGPYFPILNVFGHDMNVIVASFAVDTSPAGPPQLTSLGAPYSAGGCPPAVHPAYQITVNDTTRTLLWGDNHRHSVDFSWDADIDPPIRETLMYSLDWLGHDFISPSDHCERYSALAWVWARKFTKIMDVPGRFRIFPGYERSMQGFAGGHQNVMYRDPNDYKAATAALPVVNSWLTMYAAQNGIDVLSVPHTTAQCAVETNWTHLANGNVDSLAAPLRVAEVYQSARQSFEYPGCPLQYVGCVADSTHGWISVMLAMGIRMGLISASDHTIRAAFIGAYATDNSRDAIFHAIQDRRTFGTSRATKMNIDFRVAGAMMGTEVTSTPHPQIQVVIDGSNPLSFIEINKDGNPTWFAASSAASDTAFTITDIDEAVAGTSSFYYLRVRDSASKTIWTSPVWVDWEDVPPGTGVDVPRLTSATLSLSAFPNPARDWVDIRLAGLGPAGGRVRIHDVAGRLVRSLTIPPGSSDAAALSWDARSDSGFPVPAGVYYVVAQSHGETRAAKIVLVK